MKLISPLALLLVIIKTQSMCKVWFSIVLFPEGFPGGHLQNSQKGEVTSE